MPTPPGTRYRVKTSPSGKKTRLAFGPKGKVIEAKSMASVMADHKRKGHFGKKKSRGKK